MRAARPNLRVKSKSCQYVSASTSYGAIWTSGSTSYGTQLKRNSAAGRSCAANHSLFRTDHRTRTVCAMETWPYGTSTRKAWSVRTRAPPKTSVVRLVAVVMINAMGRCAVSRRRETDVGQHRLPPVPCRRPATRKRRRVGRTGRAALLASSRFPTNPCDT